jgi:hypothetical protein
MNIIYYVCPSVSVQQSAREGREMRTPYLRITFFELHPDPLASHQVDNQ